MGGGISREFADLKRTIKDLDMKRFEQMKRIERKQSTERARQEGIKREQQKQHRKKEQEHRKMSISCDESSDGEEVENGGKEGGEKKGAGKDKLN